MCVCIYNTEKERRKGRAAEEIAEEGNEGDRHDGRGGRWRSGAVRSAVEERRCQIGGGGAL
ncbi:unnamed protein product [Camellia sinensis]